MDISHVSRNGQFLICASGVFFFSLLYGFLQELLSVRLCSRQLGLYLATVQFVGYTFLAYILRTYVYQKQNPGRKTPKIISSGSCGVATLIVPFKLYLGLSLLRAFELAMTNLAMQYINYPAKTLIKSSRIVFTMIFGALISGKKYNLTDYAIVMCMVCGLAIFLHADATSSAVFHSSGVVMLTISLMCDGAITNMSEKIMNQYKVGQDEFIFRMYSIALVAISAAAWAKGDLADGMVSTGKICVVILFSSMGFFGSSCAAAITKQFGALSMSITSTARKATTLFLSFLLFDNECTMQHIIGIIIFICALTTKSIRRNKKKRSKGSVKDRHQFPMQKSMSMDLELGGKSTSISRESSFGSYESSDNTSTTSTIGTSTRNGGTNKQPSAHRRISSSNSSRSPAQRSRYHVV
ncbi:UAA-domain-containing protein [Fragilariopsis cylindrus CCMP1102]|uniref:UAA-domain-containing protein n=1 Tax=Fragilariopsis cylindrus CCMP1102 TaxID=635003 RepID=A0A1E7EVI5_9STRA|nr:UAA-domain-containing protein [Fragilariopsis cylindrus CCMP1102]|eukprot:OEU09991.1 UAA-domain-containing protein [Fragilariopsis cylindrus CCMP1102]